MVSPFFYTLKIINMISGILIGFGSTSIFMSLFFYFMINSVDKKISIIWFTIALLSVVIGLLMN